MAFALNSEMILNALEQNIFVKDLDGKYVFASPSYKKLFLNDVDVIGKTDDEVFPKDLAEQFERDDIDVLEKANVIDKMEFIVVGETTHTIRIVKKRFYVEHELVGILGVFWDITKENENELLKNNLSYFDSLTKLPNRILFEDRVNSRVAALKRTQKKMAILFIDIDNFKDINDTFGHSIGDKFLIEVSMYIKKFLREKDTLARLGGDEFSILLDDIDMISDIVPIANRIVNKFNKPITIDSNKLYSGVSIGISIYPDDATNYDGLIKAADTAMYQVKNSGKNGFQFYKKSMNDKLTLRMLMENDLSRAIEHNEFFLEYQPKVNLETNSVYGMEALIRWNHKEMGLLRPDKFIHIAEKMGEIYKIGLWVIQRALKDTKLLHDEGYKLRVSINISSKQLENKHFIADVCEIVKMVGLDKSYIEIEISESNIMDNVDNAFKTLGTLHEKGFKISVDDFGTGYSSLSYLKKLPAETIKIDRSFVYDIDKDGDDRSIVEAIIGMGKSLGKEVVAEGSETISQIEALKFLHCYKVQGYYFSKPLPFEIFKEFVKSF